MLANVRRLLRALRDAVALVTLPFVGLAACARTSPGSATPAPAPAAPRHGHHHRFDDAASWAKVFDDPARDAWQKPAAVVAALDVSPGMTVADLGAGTGYFEPHLARAVGAGGTVLAVDVAPDMVQWIGERARRDGLANVRASLGKPDDPGLPPAGVDRILVVDVWHHVDDRVPYAKKLVSALRPGGRLVIVDYTKTAPDGPPPKMRLAPEEVIAELEQAGLHAEAVDAGLPRQYVVVGRVPPR